MNVDSTEMLQELQTLSQNNREVMQLIASAMQNKSKHATPRNIPEMFDQIGDVVRAIDQRLSTLFVDQSNLLEQLQSTNQQLDDLKRSFYPS